MRQTTKLAAAAVLGVIMALAADMAMSAPVPSDLGGETGKRMVQVAKRAETGSWEMRGVYGSNGTLNPRPHGHRAIAPLAEKAGP